ncbi:MAG: flotillin family protein, partial [Alphaproteobacteria bacterium]|nr:flotillin family protein [Alphaproteobacteria bacterium]
KHAAADDADAMRTLATGEADKQRIAAEGDATAEKLRAAAAELRYAVDAAGKKALNEADNALSEEIVAMKVKLAIIEHLRDIVHESVKPLENIEGIKIFQLDGLNGAGRPNGGAADGGNGAAAGGNGGNLADQVVASALRYRSQAPLIDSLMQEIGLSGGDLEQLTSMLKGGGANGAGHANGANGGAAPASPEAADD